MKTNGRMGIERAVDGAEWPASRSASFTRGMSVSGPILCAFELSFRIHEEAHRHS
jgi:hypothetical protein